MAYKQALDKTPIKGKTWTLSFGFNESTGGVTPNGSNVNFTCASAIMWNVDFRRNSDSYSAYGHMGDSPVPKEERYELYRELIKKFQFNTFMVQLVGVVNGGTEARLKHYLSSENKHNYHTHDFANFLISEKIGVVVESPIFINTYHKWEGPSICQSWFWFSPSILKEGALVEHTGGIHGLDTVDKWLHDSELNKKNVGGFDGLIAAKLVDEPRFKKAAAKWNAEMNKQGIPMNTPDTHPKEGKWKKAS